LRWDIEASAGPAREALIGPDAQLLVRVRLFNGPGVLDDQGRPSNEPDVFSELRAGARSGSGQGEPVCTPGRQGVS
jgi:hypothetical protein